MCGMIIPLDKIENVSGDEVEHRILLYTNRVVPAWDEANDCH